MKERSNSINGLRQTSIYSLISLLTWQPILVRAEVAATELPQASTGWVSQGTATRIETGADMTVRQVSDRVSLQWDSFNIGRDASVRFEQPSSSSIALNKVVGGGSAASRIDGKLSANGVIYIIDSNGVIFGQNSVVEVASLIASALDVNEDLIMNESFVKAINDSKAAFEGGAAENAAIVLEGSIDGVEGARIVTGKGGSVFLFAPKVTTQKGSSITTPDGQTILAAAKDQVYLAASQDTDLRGILVEVNDGGSIDHAGKIVAERGNITLAALNIDQRGQLTATTSVDANGTIRLQARHKVNSGAIGALDDGNDQSKRLAGALMADGELDADMKVYTAKYAKATETGAVTFHEGSVTEVVPDRSDRVSADSNAQPVSFVEVTGKTIDVNSGAQITSRGGVVSLVATEHPDSPGALSAQSSAARVTLHEGSRIDVSGLSTAEVDMERNSLEIELRGDELKDSPLQRNDADIRGETAYVDIRDTDKIEFADISAYLAKIERTVDERLSDGGSVNVVSEGTVDFQQGAQVDVSGGAVTYRSGYVLESQLVDDGNLVYISDADPNRNYDAVLTGNQRYNERWNVVEDIKTSTVGAGKGTFVTGYVEGKDAGSFSITAASADYAGTLIANTVSGPYQRTGSSQADGGRLTLDLSYFEAASQSIALVTQEKFQHYLEDKTAGTADSGTTQISVERLRDSADSVTIKTRGDLTLDADATLTLDGGGALNMTGGDVDIHGDIINRGGDVTLAAKEFRNDSTSVHSLTMAAGASIDTSGEWVNDNPLLNADPNARVNQDAGDITLKSDGSVTVDTRATLHADGGAWVNAKGSLKGGKGGDVTVRASRFDTGGTLDFGGSASSHSLTEGGTLTLAGAGFDVGATPESATIGNVQLDAGFFRRGGFSEVALEAGLKGIQIADGTQIDLVGEQLQMRPDNYLNMASGTSLSQVATVVDTATLTPDEQASVNLALKSNEAELAAGSTQDGIRIGSGALIRAVPGSTIDLSATGGSIDHAGTLLALGGTVNMTVASAQDSTLDPSLAVILRDGSLIDVSATTTDGLPDALGINARTFHDAGSIDINATAGYVVAENGASLRADGADRSQTYYDANQRRLVTDAVALDAGSIAFSASEGMFLNADLSARAATGGRAGTLDVTMTTDGRLLTSDLAALDNSFRDYELEIRLTGEDADATLVQQLAESNNRVSLIDGSDQYQNGVAYLNVDRVNAGEFARVNLHALNDQNQQSRTDTYRPESRITLATDKVLRASESIRLETPALAVTGADASVAAPYVAIGTAYVDDLNSRSASAVTPDGTFTATADFIDLIGDVNFLDAEKVMLKSHGDIRLRGVSGETSLAETLRGSLTAPGDVDLLASQIYSATASDYRFNLTATDSTLHLRNQAESSDGDFAIDDTYAVYSAQGSITINADHIVQEGVLKAPFGQITLNGRQTLTLENGSRTSVSGEGLLVPYGEVQADGAWLYSATALPLMATLDEKNVVLSSPALDHKDGAVVDISGGGDLLGYEFVPGPGGSADVLNYLSGAAGESFAIVPASGSEWAAYDAVEMANFPYQIGDTIRFENVAGLDANVSYAILPARYALLPGALLITPQDVTTQPGLNVVTESGAIVAAGKWGNAGSAASDSLWSSFVVESGTVALTRSEYNLHYASEFFTASGARTQDAGRVLYDAIDRLSIDGNILASVTGDGAGGRMDVTAENITVVGERSDAIDGIQLVAGELEQLNVDSMLLGGSRSVDAEGTHITVGADSVRVAADVDMQLSEVLLAAKDTLTFESGANLRADRAGKTAGGIVQVEGDGALVQASVGVAVQVQRNNATGNGGTLNLAEDASVFGLGSLVLDATGSALLQGSIDTEGTAGFSSTQLVLGAENAEAGMALTQDTLNGLSARELVLTSLSDVKIASDVTLELNRLTIDAAAIRATEGAPVNARFNAAESIRLQNSTGITAADSASSGGHLLLAAGTIDLIGSDASTSTLTLAGFDDAQLSATERVRASGQLDVLASQDLNLSTDRLQAATATELVLHAGGDLNLTGSGAAIAATENGLGATLRFEGDRVNLDTHMQAASGVIEVQAQSGITLGNHAVLDVSGQLMDFAGDVVVSDAGTVHLETGSGNIDSQPGTLIDLSSPHVTGSSGSLELVASNGSVNLQSAPVVQHFAESTGGKLAVDVAQGSNIATLLPLLNGFSESQEWRARQGDIQVVQGTTVQSESIEFSADSGSVNIAGRLDASGAEGGSIGLYARQDVQLESSAQLLARATGSEGDGGEVVLSSRQGAVNLANGSRIDVSGNGDGSGGTVAFQLVRNEANTDVNFNDAGVVITGADSVIVTGFKPYETDTVDQSSLDVANGHNHDFMTTILASLGSADSRFRHLVDTLGERFEVAPGVEFFSTGDMNIEGDLNLAPTLQVDTSGNGTWTDNWRYGDNLTPGSLRFLAQGNLNVNGTVSDGFITLPNYKQTAPIEARSWNLALVAGADDARAKWLSTGSDGTIELASESIVRTGTGDIEVAAGNDLLLGDKSAIYTGGQSDYNTDGTAYVPEAGTLYNSYWRNNLLKNRQRMFYGHDGGDIAINVGHDIVQATAGANNTEWLYRVDFTTNLIEQTNPRVETTKYLSTWGVVYDRFSNGAGTLGGGDIRVKAGNDVTRLNLVAPTTGTQVGANGTSPTNEVLVRGGGDIVLVAGNDVLSAQYLVGEGTLDVTAGGAIGKASEEELASGVTFGAADIRMTARDSIEISHVMDQSLVPITSNQFSGTNRGLNVYFTDESADSLSVQSTTGTVYFNPDSDPIDNENGFVESLRAVLPARVQAVALAGDIVFNKTVALEPNEDNALKLYAAENIEWREASALRMAGTSATLLSYRGAAFHNVSNNGTGNPENVALLGLLGVYDNTVALRGGIASAYENPSDDPLRIVTKNGDLVGNGDTINLVTSRETEIVAGGNVRNVVASITNNFLSDVSSVQVNGDILMEASRQPNGSISNGWAGDAIALDGPGTLLVAAGGDILLGQSGGIVSNGDTINTALADTGADLLVLAGVSSTPAFEAFVSQYIKGTDEGAALNSFMAAAFNDMTLDVTQIFAITGQTLSDEQLAALAVTVPADLSQALSSTDAKTLSDSQKLFLSLSREERIQVARALFEQGNDRQQQVLTYNTLLNEVKRGGTEDSLKKSLRDYDADTDGFTRSFSAIETLFPSSQNWSGDLSLVFSTINTRDGGDVGILTPGGGVDVGLPISLPGVTKGPAELGIITTRTGDLNVLVDDSIRVNQSRTFALDGDIMMWASKGDIDAGRGAKTATGASNVNVTIDANGKVVVDYGAVIAGSGIRASNDVALFAPAGVIDAGDAGIGARGNVTLAAQQVVGADNIDVGGVSIGVPVATGVSAGVQAAGGVGSAATGSSVDEVAQQAGDSNGNAEEQVAFLTVEIIGLGE